MKTIGVIDYGMSNIDSVQRALRQVGADPVLVDTPEKLEEASALVLPGVGAFQQGMAALKARGLDAAIRSDVQQYDIPLLGICLGMQMLATTGHEGGERSGLGLVPGHVRRIPADGGLRVPHVGWNEVHPVRDHPLLDGVPDGSDFYFVHSYHMVPDDPDHAVATTPYGDPFVSMVSAGSVAGVQFHPEKSQAVGQAVLRNFVERA